MPNRTAGTNVTGNSATAIFAAAAVVEPSATIKAT